MHHDVMNQELVSRPSPSKGINGILSVWKFMQEAEGFNACYELIPKERLALTFITKTLIQR